MQHILGRVFQKMSKIKKALHEEYQSFFCTVMLTGKNTPDSAGEVRDFTWPLGWEDLLEEEMAAPSHNLAWRTPWAEEPAGLQFMGLHIV